MVKQYGVKHFQNVLYSNQLEAIVVKFVLSRIVVSIDPASLLMQVL